ncbi:MAG: helix-turn-helix transcriptional regulator [Clostridia bacterium]|nr:helix-turn-helix transcriptional regulator [Clostridia bacterium]
MKVFGEKVKELLKESGRSQRDLAAAINVQPSTLCEWLNDHNEPSMQAIVDIATYLEVSTDYLFGLKDYD